MVTVSPSRDLTVRAWPSSFSTVPRMRVGVPCGACWAPAGKISSAINAPASSNFVVIAVPPLVQLLSDVAIPNTNPARRVSRRPHFLVTPRFWAPPSPQAFTALTVNDYGQFDQLIRVLAPSLGQAGLEHLKQRMIDLSNRPVMKPAGKDRVKIGWSSSGPIFADEMAQRSRVSTVRLALTEIADALGDVDAFIEQYEEETRRVPKIAGEIARRLLSAGRAREAWQTIETTKQRRGNGSWDWPDFEWEDARIDVLEALGRADDAQAARWGCFERSLSSTHLRAYLKRLPDFDDVEAEKKAFDCAQQSRDLLQALSFLVSWPALNRAASIVLQRADELDGDHYEILTPVADALSGEHPLAATQVLRAMVDFTLSNGRSSRYRHAARHLLDCLSLASAIEDFHSRSPGGPVGGDADQPAV